MKIKKILFIGLGGAGQRHLRIFRELLPKSTSFLAYRSTSTTPLLNADFSVNSESTVEAQYGLNIYESLQLAFAESPDLTVISTPTARHRIPMLMALDSGSGVFVEKPWAEDLQKFAAFRNGIEEKRLPFHISFQRRFHPQIAKAHHALCAGEIGKPIAATFTAYSDVRLWHPYEDWKNLYAVRSDMGGGVLLTEIHELDLIYWFFGVPDKVFCTGGNRSAEQLDVEDTVQMTLEYPELSVQLTLCFLHNKVSRDFQIIGQRGDICWNGESGTLEIASANAKIDIRETKSVANDEMFFEQANKFLGNWSHADSQNSLNAAFATLSIVQAAKKSMKTGQAEMPKVGGLISNLTA